MGGPSANDDFALNALTSQLDDNGETLLIDRHDALLCETLLGTQLTKLSDLARIFLHSHHVYADETSSWGPPKWAYQEKCDYQDSFDYYSRNGCPNCGSKFSFDTTADMPLLALKVLACQACGQRPCPLHFEGESESVVDCTGANSENGTKKYGTNNSSDSVYVKGSRRMHSFGQNEKEWWQNRYLPQHLRPDIVRDTLASSDILSASKGEKVKEVCEVCGNEEAFFATFQARSADEGLTIMYECTKCHSRKTFNN